MRGLLSGSVGRGRRPRSLLRGRRRGRPSPSRRSRRRRRARPRARRRSCRGRPPRRRRTSPPSDTPAQRVAKSATVQSWVSVTWGITTTCRPTSTSAVSTTPSSAIEPGPIEQPPGSTHARVHERWRSGRRRRRASASRTATCRRSRPLPRVRTTSWSTSVGDEVDATRAPARGRAGCPTARGRRRRRSIGAVVTASSTATAVTSRASPLAPTRTSAGHGRHADPEDVDDTRPARSRSSGGTAAGSACCR